MIGVKDVFYQALEDIRIKYVDYQFMVDRDIAWMIQRKMTELIEVLDLPYEVFQDYPLEKGHRRNNGHTLMIVSRGLNYKDVLGNKEAVEVMIKIKYEPSKYRHDICDYQLPRVKPMDVVEDISELERLVHDKKTNVGISLLVDECGRYLNRIGQTQHTKWIEWGNYKDDGLNVNVLLTEF
ncbi:MAG TPA: hypothetical protein DCY20_02835 [Firmicutes bacterium]|nr:hypothetical protein [Bacillota bacterium]